MYFGKVVYNLVKAHGYKIGKLHFHHGFVAFKLKTEGSATMALSHNGVLRTRALPNCLQNLRLF